MADRILVVAAHPDDETLGCGGTIAVHTKRGDAVSVVIMADGVSARGFSIAKAKERHAACRKACKILGTEDVWLHQHPDNAMDREPLLLLAKEIEGHITRFRPNVVYTHSFGDLNVDHRVVHQAVNIACRPQPGSTVQQVFYFEVPCSSAWGDGFKPSHFVAIYGTFAEKIQAVECYAEELRDWPHPRSRQGIAMLAQMRGSSVGIGVAEGFEVGRIVV